MMSYLLDALAGLLEVCWRQPEPREEERVVEEEGEDLLAIHKVEEEVGSCQEV